MNRILDLARSYRHHISIPWQTGIAGPQRVIFALYDKTDELRLRAHLTEFELATRDAGHDWLPIDITNAFPDWMAGQRYRDAYFECPDDLDGYPAGEITEFTSQLVADIQAQLEQHPDPNQVTALIGVGALFGISHVSSLINGIAAAIPGRLLVFFPGEYENNGYRLLDARDGWNYLAVPLMAGQTQPFE